MSGLAYWLWRRANRPIYAVKLRREAGWSVGSKTNRGRSATLAMSAVKGWSFVVARSLMRSVLKSSVMNGVT